MKSLRVGVACVVILGLAACGGGGTMSKSDVKSAVRDALLGGVPSCSSFKEGKSYAKKQLNQGCTNGKTLQAGLEYKCGDGTTVYVLHSGWAFAGKPFHAGDADWSGTPELKACRGF